jgi:hypothetical protein
MRALFVWLRETSVALAMALCILPLLPAAPLPSFHFFAKDRTHPATRKRYSFWLHGPRRAFASACVK